MNPTSPGIATDHRAEYFPAVDGLRALAVLAVIAYHLNGAVPAGFIGVDIFFVISGFVVAHSTGHLPTGGALKFLAAFYARRLLRIAPALVVCVVATSLATALLVPDAWLSEQNGKTALAALLGLSNYLLAYTANDYWAPRSEYNPFTHTWSLGVEEQFYLLGPLLFFAWRAGRSRLAFWVLMLLAGLSLLAAAAAPQLGGQTLAFYSIHTRFWELAAGVALAMTQASWRPWLQRCGPGLRQACAVLALAVVSAALCWADGAAFPWPWALPAVLGAVLLIVVVIAWPGEALARMFAWRPVVQVGQLSYSLYLWHWPVFVLMRWTVGLESPVQLLAALLLSFLLATASLNGVERPIRRWRFANALPRPRIVWMGIGGLASAAVLCLGIKLMTPGLSMSVTRDLATWSWAAELPPPAGAVACESDVAKTKWAGGLILDFTPRGCTQAPRRMFVLGDSHAGAYQALLKLHVRTEGVSVRLYTMAGCSVFGLRLPMTEAAPACQQFTNQVLAAVLADARPGDLLFLPGLRVPRITDQWRALAPLPAAPAPRWDEAVSEAVQALRPLADRQVVVMFEAPKPVFAVPPFRCADWFNQSNPVCAGPSSTPRAQVDEMRQPVLQQLQRVTAQLPGAAIYDPVPALCTAQVCSAYDPGGPLFFDGDHLSGHGNAVLFASFRAAYAATRGAQ